MRTVLILIMLTSSAAATDISADVARCYNPTPGTPEFQAKLNVSLEDGGSISDISVETYSPESEETRQAIRLVSLAIERCAPYDTTGQEASVTVPFETRAPIDPFK